MLFSRLLLLSALVAGAPLAVRAQIDFDAPKTWSTNSSSLSRLAFGDFNGDGHLDVALVGLGVRLSDGDGNLGLLRNVDFGDGYLTGLTAADFDGDGNVDLAVTSDGVGSNADRVRVLLGEGDGSFEGPLDSGYNVPNPGRITAADMNDDGIPDLVLLRTLPSSNGRVSILTGAGNGSFSAIRTIELLEDPVRLTLAHLNEDRFLDLVVTDPFNDTYSLVLTDAFGVPGTPQHTLANDPSGVVAGDFDEDGDTDLAVRTRSRVLLRFNLGNGIFDFAVHLEREGGSGLAVGDFDEDSHLDLAIPTGNQLNVSFGNGLGDFSRQANIPMNGSSRVLLSVDFDEDGHQDLVFSDSAPLSTLRVHRGDGLGGFDAKELLGQGGYTVAEDFDGDGLRDFAVAESVLVRVHRALGGGEFAPADSFAIPGIGPIRSFVGADVNGDLVPDLLVSRGDKLVVLLGSRDGGSFGLTPAPVVDLSVSVRHLAPGDFDGDGLEDVLAVREDDEVEFLQGDGAGGFLEAGTTFLLGELYGGIRTGDLDADGLLDAVVVAGLGGGGGGGPPELAVAALLGFGNGSFGIVFSPVALTSVYGFALGNWNVDGHPDIALATSGEVESHIGDGTGFFEQVGSYAIETLSERQSVSTGDFDEDGFPEIVVLGDDRTASILRGDGTGRFPESTAFAVGRNAMNVQVADFDGDLHEDLLTGEVSLLRNRSLASIDARRGNVNANGGSVTDVLFLNGSAGDGAGRIVELQRDDPVDLFLEVPPSRAGQQARHAIYGWGQVPKGKTVETLPFGIGRTARSTPLNGGDPPVVWSTMGHPQIVGRPTFGSSRAPTSLFQGVIGQPITLYFQGIIIDSASPQGDVAVTNGLLVVVE